MKKKILVIDDELSIRMLLENFLSKTYDVLTRNDGMEGIKWLEEGNMPDLIVADIHHAVDGLVALIVVLISIRQTQIRIVFVRRFTFYQQ